MNKSINKGLVLEESLRKYFLNLGYYVLRGVKFRYHSFVITDVDLWLYSKPSILARQRTNVDIKNKKTPQAIERIFWTKGLNEVLGLENCIIVTTDSRPDVREFGLLNHITVIDGSFLANLQDSQKIVTQKERLSEEEFLDNINSNFQEISSDCKKIYEEAKSRILTSLNFDGSNAYLKDIQYFIEKQLMNGNEDMTYFRIIYVLISMFLITMDFILKDHVSLDIKQRTSLLNEGFRYGDLGSIYATKFIHLIADLTAVNGIIPETGKAIVDEFKKQTDMLKTEILAEFFANRTVYGNLFSSAIEFELAAFSRSLIMPMELSTNAKSILGVITDFLSVDRKKILR